MFKVISISALLLACSTLAQGREHGYNHKKPHHRPEGPVFCSTFIAFTFTPRNGSTPYSSCPQSSSTPFNGDIFQCPTLVSYPPVGQAIAVQRDVYDCEDVATLEAAAYSVTPPPGVQPIGSMLYKDTYVVDFVDPTPFPFIAFLDFVVNTNLGRFTASGEVDSSVLATSTTPVPMVLTGVTGEYRKKYSNYDFSIQAPATGAGFMQTPGLYAVDQARNIGYVVGSFQGVFQYGQSN